MNMGRSGGPRHWSCSIVPGAVRRCAAIRAVPTVYRAPTKIEPATTHLTTVASAAEVRAEVGAALGRLGAEPVDEGSTIRGRSGKKAMSRLYIGPLVSDGWYPVDHEIVLTPDGDHIRVEITVTQAFGRGLTGIGMKDRYERILREHMTELASSVP
jgi:hypothetical protein